MSFYELNRDRKRIKTISAATTIDVADCGTYFLIQAIDGAYTITLPALADAGPGWWCRFYVEDATPLGGAVKIVANSSDGPDGDGTDLMASIIYDEVATSDAAANNVAFHTTALRGAYIHVMSGGKTAGFWYTHSLSDISGSLLEDQ